MRKEYYSLYERITRRDPRYRADAYDFVLEALTYTQKKFRRPKHVSGRELLEGIKELLQFRFGPMTLSVLQHWGIQSTEDFGYIVFNLVENKALSKSADDDIEHFRDGYDFKEVFHFDYRRQLEKKISRMK